MGPDIGPEMHSQMGRGMFGQKGPGMQGRMGPGMMGMGMGMMGGNATMDERGDLHDLFFNHDKIKRTVTNLEDGIRTLTELDDPQVAATIKKHIAEMGKRVEEGRDPGLPIETPAGSRSTLSRNLEKKNPEFRGKVEEATMQLPQALRLRLRCQLRAGFAAKFLLKSSLAPIP